MPSGVELSELEPQAEAPSESDDEDEFVYNPLKLPLGYDGKPIPYWLYKLHGLNQVRPVSWSLEGNAGPPLFSVYQCFTDAALFPAGGFL